MEGIHIALAAEPVFHFWGMPVTNSLLLTWVVMALLIVIGFFVGRNPKLIPGRVQSAFESLFELVFSYIAETLESTKLAARYFPFIVTLFLFIFTANMVSFLPGIESVGITHDGHFTALLRPINTDLNVTLALAMIAFLVIELSGILTLGFLKYGSKFVTFSGGFMGFAVGILELIGNLARLISFSFRLFGNIFAGHVLIVIAVFFVPFVIPLPLMMFEVFVGLLQAAIFSLLTLVFIKLAVAEPHGGQAHSAGH